MVPLTGENRILSLAGIEVMRRGTREGIRAIADVSRVRLEEIDSDDISFRIAPRINAAGRISHARICVTLLGARERAGAEQTAAVLDQLNRKRQQTEQEILEEIERKLALTPELLSGSAIVLWHGTWNPGVLGIAASRTALRYSRPTVLISTALSPASGSGRSVGGINIRECLADCGHLLRGYGGHAMAAGLSLAPENLEAFAGAFARAVSGQGFREARERELRIDCSLGFSDITESLIREIDMLRPFGTGNPEPLFSATDVRVVSSAIIGGNHRKMILEQGGPGGGARMEALRFNLENTLDLPRAFDRIAFRLKMNRYSSRPGPQIIIEYP
jgi:single-stranded-DNA-specific exonuclease